MRTGKAKEVKREGFMGNSENIIELRHITRSFDDGFTAVSDFNLEVRRGEFVTFLGPSGCGKTTTLRMIAGFDMPTEGDILLDWQDISKLPPYERPINTVFQRYALFPHMNVYENIAFGLKQKKMDKDVIRRKVEKVLELVDLENFEERSVSSLSGGQQQRVAIARALVTRPSLILGDEPTGNLDSHTTAEIMDMFHALHEQGNTIVLITHDNDVAKTAKRVIHILDGKLSEVTL